MMVADPFQSGDPEGSGFFPLCGRNGETGSLAREPHCRTCGGQGVGRGAVFLGYVLSLAGVHDTQGLHLRLCSGVPSLEQKGDSSMEDVDSGYLAPWSVPRSRSDTGIEAV